ncbi:MAG: bifunctional (p)ppGpp synthetase/guanosine-3',5'-bis(diphosphate) 3'-pyrophosphohydrolase [Rikenellaceae bacterium]|nr:bifunctional (p)ppGpp synthetase/guanosine-3',5'-bis(diphosphate) 3'-pyrophosphohydrolase [Rikenellaceae bacterium]
MQTEKITELRERYPGLFDFVETNFSPVSLDLISRALVLADEKLAGMTRYDGSPLLDHSVRTAEIVLREVGLGRNSTVSTLLHDVVRLSLVSAEEIGDRFGEQTVGILRGLCLISEVRTKVSKDQADNFRDLIVSYSDDPRVILIKLADRLEVMRSLAMFPEAKRKKKSWESLHLYAQIAHKLGLYGIKSELEDIALSYLEPDDYRHIHTKLEESAREREQFIARFLEPIRAKLDAQGVKYHIKSRTKSIYSIWSKMRRTHVPFEEVYDIFALRIIIDCPREQEKMACWGVYSVVTDFYTPNPERMRDWISIPKSNGYESLHTTVVTKEGRWVEIQIRSERMDEVAERGIAAHWRYKGVHQGGLGSEQWLGRLRELMESTDTHRIAARFDTKLSSGEIFIFTPKGDLRKLPEGATVLDFAFDIHTNLGTLCTGGRVNQRNVSIKEVLRNGDIVEILTSKNQKPKADWLNIVTTGKARNKIKSYLREEQAKAANLGREELERKLKNWKLAIAMDDAVALLCKYYKLKTGTELYGRIADQRIDPAEVKEIIGRHLSGELSEEKRAAAAAAPRAAAAERRGDALIIDDKINNIDYKLAKCCNPIFGDDIFGFITVNAGITIHRSDCPNALSLMQRYPYRVMEARWRDNASQGAFRATIRVVADDQTGIVNHITDVLSRDMKLNIRSVNFAPMRGTLSGTISFEVPSVSVVDTVIYSIMKIKGVQKAYRINTN